MPAPDSIKRLVDYFDQNRASFLSPHYKEAQLRQDFLNPFFIALGWDLFNENHYAEAYRDVVIESSVEVEGAAKAPDYSFRVGGNRKFFVEAKKPSVNIEFDIHPAFQVRRYAWSAKLPLSILTDFEEFAVYDCRTRPDKSDKAATGRVKLLTYKDYLTRWDEIADTFSKDAVLHGKFDQFAEAATGKRGTQEVDDAFLQEIEKWRDLLARNLALRNPGLSTRELNYAVQMTIDRIIFLRICEDRQIEPEDRLKEICSGENLYPELVNLFRQADSRYNSGLFHFNIEKDQSSSPDDLTPALAIDDKVLKEIVSGLYYPSPYVFRVLPVEILGQVYERFLGKVIRLTVGHQAKVEEKPEVRKAGGVYYTPTYIVDYIVKNTVGKLLENKTPAQAASLKIVDPACGSGSFLLGAYQYLLDWHTKWYSDNQPEKWSKGKSPAIYQAQGGWRLTTAEKKKILLNNIHGVDIDPQAVEVTKLSLSLKVLEGESQETINSQLSLFKERALPDLGNNIQCGNSLIGSDYNEGKLFSDEEEHLRVNPFDWKVAFPQVFAQGGFDAVIGNPPYIRIQALKEWAPKEVELYKKHYKAASKGNYDIYVVFVEKGLKLIAKSGILGFILPSKFFATDYGEYLRGIISDRNALRKIVDFGSLQIFDQATTYTCLLFLSGSKQEYFDYSKVNNSSELQDASIRKIEAFVSQSTWTFSDKVTQLFINKLNSSTKPLGELPARIGRGSSTGNDAIFILHRESNKFYTREHEQVKLEPEILRTPIFATSFGRYEFRPSKDEAIIFPYHVNHNGYDLFEEKELSANYPKTYEYLLTRKKGLEKRKQHKSWFSFSAPRNLDVHDSAQILVPLLADKGLFCRISKKSSEFCLMASGGFSITVSPNCPLSPDYVLGLLNSKLLTWRLRSISNVFRGGWFTCTKQYVETLPIRLIDFSKKYEIALYEEIISLVEKMLSLKTRTFRTPQEKETLQREIAATDKQIDDLVYQLYGLTSEEIKIVEVC
jgi:type I restriction-modification system DNA methylase subunit